MHNDFKHNKILKTVWTNIPACILLSTSLRLGFELWNSFPEESIKKLKPFSRRDANLSNSVTNGSTVCWHGIEGMTKKQYVSIYTTDDVEFIHWGFRNMLNSYVLYYCWSISAHPVCEISVVFGDVGAHAYPTFVAKWLPGRLIDACGNLIMQCSAMDLEAGLGAGEAPCSTCHSRIAASEDAVSFCSFCFSVCSQAWLR